MRAYDGDMDGRHDRGSATLDWVQIPALRLLVALTDAGSLGVAARRVDVAQPNASRSITMLERRTGLKLLDRTPQGSTLTQEGRLLAEWARDVVESVDRLASGTLALSGTGKGRLSMGASHTVAEHLAPLWISQLNHTHPQIRVVLEMQNSERVIAGVTAGDYEIGFVESPSVPAHLHQAVITEDPLELVVAPDHPWAERGEWARPGDRAQRSEQGGSQLSRGVALTELAQAPLVIREPGSGTRALVDRVLAPFDPVRPITELNSTAAIIRAVRAGAGPAILSRLAVTEELAEGQLVRVPVRDGRLTRELRAVWTGPSRLVGAAARMLETAVSPPRGPRTGLGRQ